MPIFDQGYHHWHGLRSGLGMRWWAITRRGVAVEQRWWLTRLLCIAAFFPALILVLALTLWGLAEQKTGPLGSFLPPVIRANPRAYRMVVWTICYQYYFRCQLFGCMLLVALVGPRLISQDLRFNAIPLYFSRPLRRFDYFIGKWGVIASFIAIVAIAPAVVAWVCGIAFSLDPTTIVDTWRVGLGAVGYGVLITVSAGTLMLAFSSLTRRSGYVIILWFGFWLFTTVLASAVIVLAVVHQQREAMAKAQEEKPEAAPPLGEPATPAKRPEPLDTDRVIGWYPIISYTSDLERVGHALLGTRDAWQKLQDLTAGSAGPGATEPSDQSQSAGPRLTDFAGAGYPWYWSGAVLAGLFALSIVILRARVRTLDRLK